MSQFQWNTERPQRVVRALDATPPRARIVFQRAEGGIIRNRFNPILWLLALITTLITSMAALFNLIIVVMLLIGGIELAEVTGGTGSHRRDFMDTAVSPAGEQPAR